MLGHSTHLPCAIFTDRGTGMYSPLGMIVGRFEAAIKKSGMQTLWGPDDSMQSPDIPDLLLHETAVAIFHKRPRIEKPWVVPWKQTEAEWTESAARVMKWLKASC